MRAERIAEILGADYTITILRVIHEPKSAQEISEKVAIPIATVYRRVKELTDIGFLKKLEYEKDRPSKYRRKKNRVCFTFEKNAVGVDLRNQTRVVQPFIKDRPLPKDP